MSSDSTENVAESGKAPTQNFRESDRPRGAPPSQRPPTWSYDSHHHYPGRDYYHYSQQVQNDRKRSLEGYPAYSHAGYEVGRTSFPPERPYDYQHYPYGGYPYHHPQGYHHSANRASSGSQSNSYLTATTLPPSIRDYSHASNYRSRVCRERLAERKRESMQAQQVPQRESIAVDPLTPPSAFKATPMKDSQMISSPPPTTLNVPARKNRDSIGSTLSRDSIGNISLAPSQLDSFDLDFSAAKSPTSLVISALLQGASMIATVDRPDEPPAEEVEERPVVKAVFEDKGDSHDKENAGVPAMKKKAAATSDPPLAKRALLPTDSIHKMNLDAALANPVVTIMENPELKRLIVIQMALQRDAVSLGAGANGKVKLAPNSDTASKIMQPGFFWRDYPALETVLYENMAVYYEHSNASSANQGLYKKQQAYNNSLVALIKNTAVNNGYQMSQELLESDKNLRDRIRCFYKTHIQNAKKRLATMMKHDSPPVLLQLRALIRAIILDISLEEALSLEKAMLQPTSDTDEARKRGSGSSSSSLNSIVGLVDHPSSNTSFAVPYVPSNPASDDLPPLDVHSDEVEPFFNLEDDSLLVAGAVSTRNVAFHGHYHPPHLSGISSGPPSHYHHHPPQHLTYYPPTKKPRPSSTANLNSRVPNPLPSRSAK